MAQKVLIVKHPLVKFYEQNKYFFLETIKKQSSKIQLVPDNSDITLQYDLQPNIYKSTYYNKFQINSNDSNIYIIKDFINQFLIDINREYFYNKDENNFKIKYKEDNIKKTAEKQILLIKEYIL